jgi:hypothetical protein
MRGMVEGIGEASSSYPFTTLQVVPSPARDGEDQG